MWWRIRFCGRLTNWGFCNEDMIITAKIFFSFFSPGLFKTFFSVNPREGNVVLERNSFRWSKTLGKRKGQTEFVFCSRENVIWGNKMEMPEEAEKVEKTEMPDRASHPFPRGSLVNCGPPCSTSSINLDFGNAATLCQITAFVTVIFLGNDSKDSFTSVTSFFRPRDKAHQRQG